MSYYSLTNKYIFLHIPKTGGTSIKFALQEIDPTLRPFSFSNHASYSEIEQELVKKKAEILLDGMKVFMVVRNPWERMVSLYKHRERKLLWEDGGVPRNTQKDIECVQKGFTHWLLNTENVGDRWLTRTAQIKWGRGMGGGMKATHIMRQDALNRQWGPMCEALGIRFAKLKQLNVGKWSSEAYREHYTIKGIDHISKHFAEDIAAFGFKF